MIAAIRLYVRYAMACTDLKVKFEREECSCCTSSFWLVGDHEDHPAKEVSVNNCHGSAVAQW